MDYPFDDDLIEREELINWLAQTLYPREIFRDAKKKVRSSIRYWEVNKKQLSRVTGGNKVYYEAAPFFSLAISKKGWRPLIKVRGLPLQPTTLTGRLRTPGFRFEGRAIPTPQDLETAQRMHQEAETARYQLTKENAALKDENAKLQAEVKLFRSKEAATRKKRSDAGKLGKDVPRKKH